MSKFSENIVVKFTRTVEVCIPKSKPTHTIMLPVITKSVSIPGRVVRRKKSAKTVKQTSAQMKVKSSKRAKPKTTMKEQASSPARPVRPGLAKCKLDKAVAKTASKTTQQQAKFWLAVARKRVGLGRGDQ